MQVTDVNDWDRSPVRELLVSMLPGANCAAGDLEAPLDDLLRAGLVEEYTVLDPKKHPREAAIIGLVAQGTSFDCIWRMLPSPAGTQIALRLASSDELVQLLVMYGLTAQSWDGIPPVQVAAELDRRNGGSGNVTSLRDWCEAQDPTSLYRLPRLYGLDGHRDAG